VPRHPISFLLLCLAIGVVYLGGLGNFPLTERSEARYAGVSWEMLRTGDYLTPRYNGIKHFHKPPLFYWLTAGSMRLFGDSEGAARLPCALAALATLAGVGWLARRPDILPSQSRPWVAVACLATSPFFWEMGRIAVTDMLVTALVVGALASAWSILQDGPGWRNLALFWASLGLNFLNKGPVGPLIVALALCPYLFWRSRRSWRAFAPLPGMALALAIGLPWYLWVVAENSGLFAYFLKFQTADRVFSNVHRRDGPIWFYLPVILGGFLPWTCWLPTALKESWKKAREPKGQEANPDLFLLGWLIVPTIFFSLIGSKLPPYVLPLFPALALLVARHLASLTLAKLASPVAVLGIAGVACAAQLQWGLIAKLTTFSTQLGWAAGWLLLTALVGAGMAYRRRESALLVVLTVAMLGLLSIAISAFGKLSYLSAQPMCQAMRRQASGPFEVAMYGSYLFGLPYYLGQNITHVQYPREVQFETDLAYRRRIYDDLSSFLPTFHKGDQHRFLIVPRAALSDVQSQTKEPVVFIDHRFAVLFHAAEPGTAP
jgi:4-amino-4-deoxy-L-arabinose transferase-like glycosyltransferase